MKRFFIILIKILHKISEPKNFFILLLACINTTLETTKAENNYLDPTHSSITASIYKDNPEHPLPQLFKIDHPSLYIELLILDDRNFVVRYAKMGINSETQQTKPNVFELEDPSRLIIDIPEPGHTSHRTLYVESHIITRARLSSVASTTNSSSSKDLEYSNPNTTNNSTRLVIDLAIRSISHPQIDIDNITGVVSIVASEMSLINIPPMESVSLSEMFSLDKPNELEKHIAPNPTPQAKPILSEDSGDQASSAPSLGKESITPPPKDVTVPVLERMYFKVTNAIGDLSPAFYLEVHKLESYELTRRGDALYQLTLTGAKLSPNPIRHKELLLPQYAPQDFDGLLEIAAKEEVDKVTIDIVVNPTYQLKPFRIADSLWVIATKER